MELLSKDTRLEYSSTRSGTYKALYGLKTSPEMGGDPEKVDITNLKDGNKRYLKGVKDFGELDFGFFYNSEEENPNVTEDEVAASYKVLRALDKSGAVVYFKLIYPDETGFAFAGEISVKRSAADVNQPLSFTLRVMCTTELDDVDAPTQGS